VAQQNIQHSMREVVAQLEGKIKELEGYRAQIERQMSEGKTTPANTESLARMSENLSSAKGAMKLLMDSCCVIQTCDYKADL
jgi:phage shock protein A